MILLGGNNKNSDKSIWLFYKSIFFFRVLLLILLPGKTLAWINWTDSTVGWDDLMKYIPFIISTTRLSKTCSWYYFHMAFQSIFFFWIYFLFFHQASLSNSISRSFETWVLSHLPSFPPRIFRMLQKLVNTNRLNRRVHHGPQCKYKLLKHFLIIFFTVSIEINLVLVIRIWNKNFQKTC